MFEQHPVPQQISSYQFRLVGDMTLKQFFQLAAGAILALVIYATPLPSLFKWPLIIIFVIAGAAFAFLPLQERPLEEWISAFFRAVYGPTLYRWKKDSNLSYFASTAAVSAPPIANPTSPVAHTDVSVSKMETKETTFLSNITNLFNPLAKPAPVTPPVPAPIAPVSDATPVPQTVPVSAINTNSAPQVSSTQAQILSAAAKTAPVVSYTAPAPKAGTLFVATPVTPNISTPKAGFVAESTAPVAPLPKIDNSTTLIPTQTHSNTGGIQVQFSPDAAPPSPATIPNVIVGQVMDAQNKIVEGAILEVKDFQGRPVRALKTNKAGHFMIVTPLPSGSYQMNIEKEGLTFEPVNFEMHGAIVEPMAIRSKENKTETTPQA